jgi:hypothetical protein
VVADVLTLAVVLHHQGAAQSALGDTQPAYAGADGELARAVLHRPPSAVTGHHR